MINKILDSKIFYIVLSVFAAILLWLYVGEQDDATLWTRDIPITFTGEDVLAEQGLMIVHRADETIDLRLQARRTVLKELSNKTVSIQADVSQITAPGQHSISYTISYPSNVQPSSVSVIDRSEYVIDVQVVQLTRKTIPVEAEFTGSLAEGYLAGDIACTPSALEISGEESAVSRVDHAVIQFGSAGLSETFSQAMPYTLVDADGKPVDTSNIRLELDTVLVTMPVEIVKEIPLIVYVKEGGGATERDAEITIEPGSIQVSGERSVLEPLNQIILDTIDLSQVVSSATYNITIPLNSALTNLSGVTEAKVTVRINGLATRTVECTDIEAVNRPAGYTTDVVTQSIQVVLRGTEEAVAAIQDHNVRVVADLSTISTASGTYTVPAQVYVDGVDDVGAVGEYKIVVSIH